MELLISRANNSFLCTIKIISVWRYLCNTFLSVTPRVQSGGIFDPVAFWQNFSDKKNSFQSDILPHVLLLYTVADTLHNPHSRMISKLFSISDLFLKSLKFKKILMESCWDPANIVNIWILTWTRCKGKTLLGFVSKLFVFSSI